VHVFGLAVGERRVPAPLDPLVRRQPPRPLPLEEQDGLCQSAMVVGRAQTTAAKAAGAIPTAAVVSSKPYYYYYTDEHQCHDEHPHLHRHAWRC